MTQAPPPGPGLRDPSRQPRGESLHRRGSVADTTRMGKATTSVRASVSQLAPAAFPATRQSLSLEPLVGSRRERAHLEKMLRDARAGHSAVTGIHGLAGSGKSYLVETMIAEASGFTVVRLPVTAGVDGPASDWRYAFQIAQDATGSAGQSAAEEADVVRQSFSAAIRSTSRNATGPVLLIFEDCRLTDHETAEDLAAAVLDPELGVPAVLVLTWRDSPDGTTMSFTRTAFPVHKLQPLTLDQSADYLVQRIGKLPDPSVLAELWRATGGNPAALLSACSHLSDEELDGFVPLPDPIPIGSELADAFGSWADSLGSEARTALTVAATAFMTRPILEDALAQANLSIEALRPATQFGALALLGDRVEFAHPLCRAAVFQRATSSQMLKAREAVAHAYRRAGLPERAAVHAALSSDGREATVASLCTQAAQNASQRSDPEAAARFEMLGAQFALNAQRAAQHLVRASSLWQAAGRPERAMECLRRVTPMNSSAALLGQATYRAARIEFATAASPTSAAQMALGAEACATDETDDAVSMLADAAASALLTDQIDQALQYARRAVEVAAGASPVAADMARLALDAVASLVAADAAVTHDHDSVVNVMNSQGLFTGSPQLAYVLGSALVPDAPPALIGRWFAWMQGSAGVAVNRPLSAVIAMVRAKERLDAGDVTEAVAAADHAVSQLESLHDHPLLSRALGWSAWAQASAGETRRTFETAAKFFSLETVMTHSARLQVLTALAHSELQRGHLDRATAWLRAVEDESVTRDGYQGCADWPLLPVFLLLALLADYESQRMHLATSAQPSRGPGHWPRLLAWSEALRQTDPAASLSHLDELVSGPVRGPMLNAQIKLTSALLQRKLGSAEVAQFNFMQASMEFQRCHAHGWSALAASCLEGPGENGDDPATVLSVRALDAASPDTAAADPITPTQLDLDHSAPVPHPETVRRSTYEIRLLGQFSVLRDGTPAAIPLGHAAQALKAVVVFRRISVDNLAELLWPGAEPGVGTRRLRNILWRIKSSSGDLLRRDDNLICLEEGVVTDISLFEEAAARAFKEGLSLEEAHGLAREAIRLYGGELLPSDRYADWTTGPRESLTQMRLQLLDLMLAHATEAGNRQEAFALLEDLIDADPYEERYYIQLATLHLEAGNRSRMRASISRGERMLADLGVEPSKEFADFVGSIPL